MVFDSFRAHVLTVNVHCGALLLVPQRRCIISFSFYNWASDACALNMDLYYRIDSVYFQENYPKYPKYLPITETIWHSTNGRSTTTPWKPLTIFTAGVSSLCRVTVFRILLFCTISVSASSFLIIWYHSIRSTFYFRQIFRFPKWKLCVIRPSYVRGLFRNTRKRYI